MKKLVRALIIVITVLTVNRHTVFAHESVTVGDYELEIGWVQEPPIEGQQNGILVTVSDTSGGGDQPVEDVSSLVVTVSYGGQEKELTLQPLGEDILGQFIAPLIPAVPGQYTVLLGGQLGDNPVDAQVDSEEVVAADTLQFPSAESSDQNADAAFAAWLTWLAVLLGLVGIGLGVTALRKAG